MTNSKYPFGSKSEATAICRCGQVEITLSTQNPVLAGFCHCEDCEGLCSTDLSLCTARLQIFKTGQSKKGSFELMIRRGFDQRLMPNVTQGAMFQVLTTIHGGFRLFLKIEGLLLNVL